uniref:Lysyl-tRNA synthetase, class 2 n=1 Tax=Candidatus Kentrum sp. DK TaxID=2126562 RepID=A0A450SG43_9GAMM|nr:MAG: lysyl-tRNA synthetase, class 2 [Candidatus Kentron sp. DK]VFJ53801.1 MAG: lysyl-tRNA synthetase, class 2 [Candidatus Kentron sp. DK]
MNTRQEAWHPAAELAALRLRARILARIRAFFAERGVLEVETPLLASTTTTEPNLASIEARGAGFEGPERVFYLQTSPESFMKRLLAAGAGPIFQLGKAFRAGEVGRHHNPEFTILEWYRPGFDSQALMDEVEALAGEVLGTGAGERIAYRDAFLRHAGLDPFQAPLPVLRDYARRLGLSSGDSRGLDRDACLDLILSRVVQPALGPGSVFITGFPASQAAMARLVPRDPGDGGSPGIAERFEWFFDGIELANGYRELGDAHEQRARFLADGQRRDEKGLPSVPLDERLLGALAHGLPDCSGVALGVDRLVMLAASKTSLDEVLAFPFGRV